MSPVNICGQDAPLKLRSPRLSSAQITTNGDRLAFVDPSIAVYTHFAATAF
ncbi:hypothetical protein [Chroococcidiopsis sp. SAG 2025]|uniref:hypothetical protein n=1 Tax=Chroococcidiopsis sp. SAG 2025 TaxID=171389 RepID=UPI002936EADC|nr:hypothetical protein [Chroococcidiopsis sp. SAG 2025]